MIADEFPDEKALPFDDELADAYTRLRSRAIELESAIINCLDLANGRQSERGKRAENAFALIEAAIYQPKP